MKQYIKTCILYIMLIAVWMPSPGIANNLNASVSFCDAATCESTYGSLIVNITQDNNWGLQYGYDPTNCPECDTIPPNNYDAIYFFIMINEGNGWKNLDPSRLNHNNSKLISTPEKLIPVAPISLGWLISCFDSYPGDDRFSLCSGGLDVQIQFDFIEGSQYDFDVKIFAFEMVRIQSSQELRIINGDPVFVDIFIPYLGDGDGTSESVNAFHLTDNFRTSIDTTISVDINDFDDTILESGITLTNVSGITNYSSKFPHTESGFYCMKYEITQGAYRDFLNTLIYDQQVTRTANLPTSTVGTGALTTSGTAGNFIEIKQPSDGIVPAIYGCDASNNNVWDEANDGENVACNFLSWMDIAAWLDWAGMGPMTEIQYEYICRGDWLPSPGEYAWGYGGEIAEYGADLNNAYTEDEQVTNASTTVGNANYGGTEVFRPLRNGIFATSSTNRTTSGAAYWGVMEMSGNVNEACVTVGNSDGRNFAFNTIASTRGDGVLSANGNALVDHWPGNGNAVNAEVTGNSGTIIRGGHFNSPANATKLSVSDRSQGAVPTTRTESQGGRGVIN